MNKVEKVEYSCSRCGKYFDYPIEKNMNSCLNLEDELVKRLYDVVFGHHHMKTKLNNHALQSIVEILEMRTNKESDTLSKVRSAVADYIGSEGCSCCRGEDHDEHLDRLSKLLEVPEYEDYSGYSFSQFRSKK